MGQSEKVLSGHVLYITHVLYEVTRTEVIPTDGGTYDNIKYVNFRGD